MENQFVSTKCVFRDAPLPLLLLAQACSCPKPENNQTSQTSPLTSKTASSPSPQISASNTPLKSSSTKTASVISENAELRQTPNGKVLQTLPFSSSVEVIRQKGAWFYVAYGSQKGWLHGNTIRYVNEANNSTIVKIPNKETKSYNESTTIEKSNPSGATAQCRDGTLSYSASRRETCSHHGGVAIWY